jgi:hypothetical protein
MLTAQLPLLRYEVGPKFYSVVLSCGRVVMVCACRSVFRWFESVSCPSGLRCMSVSFGSALRASMVWTSVEWAIGE